MRLLIEIMHYFHEMCDSKASNTSKSRITRRIFIHFPNDFSLYIISAKRALISGKSCQLAKFE